MTNYDPKALNEILAANARREGALIPLLQAVQNAFGYVPEEAIEPIAEATGVFPSQIYGVLTFYAQFRLKPMGESAIRVCHGTACHVGGAERIMDRICEELGIEEGETTADGKFSVEKIFCVGSCSLAPVVQINGRTYGRLNENAVGRLVRRIASQARESSGPSEKAPVEKPGAERGRKGAD